MFTRFFVFIASCFLLSGCWTSDDEQFLTESLLVADLPEQMAVTYNGSTALVKRHADSRTSYAGFGFEELKFKRIKFGLFAQGYDAETQKYTFFMIANNGEVAMQLRQKRSVNLTLRYPNQPIVVSNNNFGVNTSEVASQTQYRKGTVRIHNLDGMTDQEVASLVENSEKNSAGSRYQRAFNDVLLGLCSKRRAIIASGSVVTLLSSVRAEGGRCVTENAFAKQWLGLAGIQNLNCTGSGEIKTCTFTYSLTCLMTTTVANNMALNQNICDGIRSLRQPARAKVRDDGKEVEFLSLELLQ